MIVVYGGTFDPVHIGHLRLAFEARETLAAELLCFLPCHVPPHRPAPLASGPQRADWIARCLAGLPGFGVDRRELARSGPSYSILTVRELRAELAADQPLVWLIGEDALSGLPSWHQADALWQYCHFAVLRRPTTPDRAALQAQYRERLAEPAELHASPCGRITWLDNSLLDVSASDIRQRLAIGRSARFLVCEQILAEVESSALGTPGPSTG